MGLGRKIFAKKIEQGKDLEKDVTIYNPKGELLAYCATGYNFGNPNKIEGTEVFEEEILGTVLIPLQLSEIGEDPDIMATDYRSIEEILALESAGDSQRDYRVRSRDHTLSNMGMHITKNPNFMPTGIYA